MASESVPRASAAVSASGKNKVGKLDKLFAKVKSEPIVYGFLGLTVAALTGGLTSLYTNNKKQSQVMMRARVFFQFCTISALLGGVYYRAYSGQLNAPSGVVRTDNRAFDSSGAAFALDQAADGDLPPLAPDSMDSVSVAKGAR